MYQSLELLRIEPDEANLKNRFRGLRLFLSKNLFSLFAGLCFIGFGAAALFLAYEWTWVTPLKIGRDSPLKWTDWAMFWGFMSLFFVTFPLLGWLLNPSQYEFITAKITKSHYRPSTTSRRHQLDRIIVHVSATHHEEKIKLEEKFATWIWLFTDVDSDVKKGDDWYSLKGKRPKLPLDAYILTTKKAGGRATLVGIAAHHVDPALEIIHAENRKASIINWLGLAFIILGTILYGILSHKF